jgi:hypothetical protein
MGNNLVLVEEQGQKKEQQKSIIEEWLIEREQLHRNYEIARGVPVPENLILKDDELWLVEHLNNYKFPTKKSNCKDNFIAHLKTLMQNLKRSQRILALV